MKRAGAPGLTSPAGGLAARVIHSGLWLVGLDVTGRIVGLVRLLVVARLLTPHDFGLVGMALVVLSLFSAFSATGVRAALIQGQVRSRELLDTAWTIAVTRGVLVAGLLMLAAPLIGTFFGAPDGVPVVRAMALVPLILGLQNVGVVEFHQELAFRSHYVLHTLGVLADLVVAVGFALWWQNAWALVAGWAALSVVRAVASYLLHPYRPRLRFDPAAARQLLGFGRWVLGSQALSWLLGDGVNAVVGRLFGVTTLAVYQMGTRVAAVSLGELAAVPDATEGAYAKLQHTPDRLRQAYLRVVGVVALTAAPTAAGLVVYAEPLVHLLIGDRWLAVVPIVQLLAVRGFLRSVGRTTWPVFRGTGRPRRETLAVLIECVPVAVGLVPLTLRLGAPGAALAATLGAAAGAGMAVFMVSRDLRIRTADLGSRVGWPILAALPALVLPVGVVGMPTTLGDLALAVSLSAGVYGASIFLLAWPGVYEPDPVVATRLRRWLAAVRPRRETR